MNPQKRIRVLVVDDSAVMRRAISTTLADPAIEVVGTAADPYEARDKILALNPDVLTLDIEMPRMDGLTFLRILQKHRPLPVIIVSSLTQVGSRAALEALEAGAVDVVAKPHFVREQLVERVKGAANVRTSRAFPNPAVGGGQRLAPVTAAASDPRQLILLGASTGGTEALKDVLTRMPDGLPGICIVQHIPALFSRTFAERLNELCAFEVREAVHGDTVRPGLALVAPGDFHMTLVREGSGYRVALNQQPPLHYMRPAVDQLFDSAAAIGVGKHCVAALLTGMGSDGARGMQRLRAAGAFNIAQNEETCVVYGMPRAAVEMGVVDQVLPLEDIPAGILRAIATRATNLHPAKQISQAGA